MLNTLILIITWHNEPRILTDITTGINFLFAAIFTVEAAFKILAYGKTYFKEGWNNFDFAIVVGTAIGILIGSATSVKVGP